MGAFLHFKKPPKIHFSWF